MPKLGTKPALTLGITAAMVMGASGISAQARVANTTSGTTPTTQSGRPGPGLGADATALAKRLGVTVADLQAAVKAVRDSESKPDQDAERVTEAKTIADALSVDQATVQAVLDDEKPQAKPNPPKNATPPTGAPTGTTPPAGAPTGTTPPAGGGHGGPGGGPGGHGDHNEASDTTLIAALVKATGKDEAAVTAALTKADAVRDAAQKERAADFAKKLAAQLHLDADKVATAIENSRPTAPAKAARQSTAQTK